MLYNFIIKKLCVSTPNNRLLVNAIVIFYPIYLLTITPNCARDQSKSCSKMRSANVNFSPFCTGGKCVMKVHPGRKQLFRCLHTLSEACQSLVKNGSYILVLQYMSSRCCVKTLASNLSKLRY